MTGAGNRCSQTDLLGHTDASVTSCETDAVDGWVLSQEVPNLRSFACMRRAAR